MPTSVITKTSTLPLSLEFWPLEKLLPYGRNARTHSDRQVQQIAASIQEFGFINPILADSESGILAGHARAAAARSLEMAEVPVIVLDHLTEAQKRAFIIADNQIALNADWDRQLLKAELAALDKEEFDLTLIAFAESELRELMAGVGELIDEDAVPQMPVHPTTVTGDIWQLGDHRLGVGDATDLGCVTNLMRGNCAQLIFTDPPYNVDYEGYTQKRMSIANDKMPREEFCAFLEAAFRAYRSAIKPTASFYVCHPSAWQREFQNAIESAGFSVRSQLIWSKQTFAWGYGRYKFQHEPIFYGHVTGEKDNWFGSRSQSTIWEISKPAASRLHPTMKPIELIDRALLNSSKSGDLVIDFFGGSGSTLIAAERRKRTAYLMEMDPRYADVIIKRWQQYTGRDARLEGAGETFKEVTTYRASATVTTREAL